MCAWKCWADTDPYYDWRVWTFIVIYVLFNILGTVYYTLLKRRGVTSGPRAVGLATVLLGWCGLPLVNLTSVALYNSDYHVK